MEGLAGELFCRHGHILSQDVQKGRSPDLKYCLKNRKEIVKDFWVELAGSLLDEPELL